jgi:hypothetical protein
MSSIACRTFEVGIANFTNQESGGKMSKQYNRVEKKRRRERRIKRGREKRKTLMAKKK